MCIGTPHGTVYSLLFLCVCVFFVFLAKCRHRNEEYPTGKYADNTGHNGDDFTQWQKIDHYVA